MGWLLTVLQFYDAAVDTFGRGLVLVWVTICLVFHMG